MAAPPAIILMPSGPVTASTPAITVITTIAVVPTVARLFPMVGAWTPAAAPLRSPVASIQLPPQLPSDLLHVHEVAVPTSIAVVLLELSAGGLAKIRDRREVGDDGATRVEPPLKSAQSRLSLFFFLELDVDVPHHVIGKVVTHIEALDLPELVELLEYVLVEVLEMLLDLPGVDGLPLGVHAGGDHIGPLVHVGEQEGGRYGGAVVEPGTSVPVPACPNLEVEWTIHPVLLRTKYRSQVLRH